jgi:hypothetical protein
VAIGMGWPKKAARSHGISSGMMLLGCWVPSLSLVDNIKFISFIILVILTRGSIILLNYIRSGSPVILEAVIIVLGSWRSAS